LSVALVLGAVALAQHLGPWASRALRSRHLEANVLIIVVDTLRADRVGAVGHGRSLTPRIDDFARDAVTYDHAYSAAPWTLPSMASLYTSRVPREHGAGGRFGEFRILPEEPLTLAEVFARNGAITAALVNVIFLGPVFGMHRGFEEVDQRLVFENVKGRDAAETTDDALAWLRDHGDDRFFLLVHYFDPHLKYDPPEPYRSRLAGDVHRAASSFGSEEDMIALRRGEKHLDDGTIRDLEKLYDAEVAYTDAEVGRFLRGMRDAGLADETLVIILSDHGEEFLDHGGFEHAHTLYDELLHVPLVIRPPGHDRGAVTVSATANLLDVAPTACELAGLPVPDDFSGKSLAPTLGGEDGSDRGALSMGKMWGPVGHAWRSGRYKIISEPSKGPAELYDFRADPRELSDLAEERKHDVARMERELRSMLQEMGEREGDPSALSDDQVKVLRSLGYVQ
jgi:arylsulfatase A-like enzyme